MAYHSTSLRGLLTIRITTDNGANYKYAIDKSLDSRAVGLIAVARTTSGAVLYPAGYGGWECFDEGDGAVASRTALLRDQSGQLIKGYSLHGAKFGFELPVRLASASLSSLLSVGCLRKTVGRRLRLRPNML